MSEEPVLDTEEHRRSHVEREQGGGRVLLLDTSLCHTRQVAGAQVLPRRRQLDTPQLSDIPTAGDERGEQHVIQNLWSHLVRHGRLHPQADQGRNDEQNDERRELGRHVGQRRQEAPQRDARTQHHQSGHCSLLEQQAQGHRRSSIPSHKKQK